MLSFQPSVNSIVMLISTILLSVIDIRERRIPDSILSVVAFVSIVLALVFDRGGLLHRFILSSGAFLAMYLLSVVTKNGLGFGDVKLISVASFNLGLFDTWIMLTVACLSGIAFVSGLRIFKGKTGTKIPFAPFLCLGAFISLFANLPKP